MKTLSKNERQQQIVDNLREVRAFAKGLLDAHSFHSHSDDYWSSYELNNGDFVDINLHVYDEDDLCYISAVAYPLDDDYNIITTCSIVLFRQVYLKNS
jgi:hypothetical protein